MNDKIKVGIVGSKFAADYHTFPCSIFSAIFAFFAVNL